MQIKKQIKRLSMVTMSGAMLLAMAPQMPANATYITPDSNGFYYHDHFEDDSCGWEVRGSGELTLVQAHGRVFRKSLTPIPSSRDRGTASAFS